MRPTSLLMTRAGDAGVPGVAEARLLRTVTTYLTRGERKYIEHVLDYARQLRVVHAGHGDDIVAPAPAGTAPVSRGQRGDSRPGGEPSAARTRSRTRWDFGYVISVAQALAETVHMDAEGLAAVLLYQAVELGLASAEAVNRALGGRYGAATVDLIQRIERFDALQRPAAARRRLVVSAERGEVERTAANRA
ncbi:MAG TPA: hypothetical protein VGN32_08380, partial [Ktedonobacterales bacterium]|nr:hypothetical protein [Ktedonobacterales bacterium]